MTSLFVDTSIALENIRIIASAATRAGPATVTAVEVGEGLATATLGRLSWGVALFPGTLAVQLVLAGVALGAVVDAVSAADDAVSAES